MTHPPGSVTVDETHRMVYVYLRDQPVARTGTFGDHRMVDFSRSGEVVGVEFIGYDETLDLDDLPAADEVSEAMSAAGWEKLLPPGDSPARGIAAASGGS